VRPFIENTDLTENGKNGMARISVRSCATAGDGNNPSNASERRKKIDETMNPRST